jgi:hypothetical protein
MNGSRNRIPVKKSHQAALQGFNSGIEGLIIVVTVIIAIGPSGLLLMVDRAFIAFVVNSVLIVVGTTIIVFGPSGLVIT